jgi:RND family efflux transporter MFP subunit
MNARNAARSAALVLMASGLLAACGTRSTESVTKPTAVRVQAAETGPATAAIETNGVVATKDEMRLSFKVGGVIKAIYVRQGQTVARGAKLAEIELTEIDSQVTQMSVLADKARRDLERGERLYADHVISLVQLQDLRTQLDMQQAQLKAAQFNRGLAVIVAPRNGVVLRKLADERELMPAGQPVLVLGALDSGYVVRAGVADRDVVQLSLGDPAHIRMDAYPGREIQGTVTEIASAADDKTGLFPIEVRFDSQPVSLATGLVAKLSLLPASMRTGVLTYVPIGAVVEGDGDRASVFVLHSDHVVRRSVEIAFIGPERVALRQGLAPGEPVVTDGALYLTDGERVELVSQAAQATQTTHPLRTGHVATANAATGVKAID